MKVRLLKSRIGIKPKQKKVLDSLGLRRIRQERELPDNDSVKGMVRKVEHLVEVVE